MSEEQKTVVTCLLYFVSAVLLARDLVLNWPREVANNDDNRTDANDDGGGSDMIVKLEKMLWSGCQN